MNGIPNEISEIGFQFRGRKGILRMANQQGRDLVLSQVSKGGWRSYEAPLPAAICEMVTRRPSIFFDIGANTGFYSLVASLAGCDDIRAFEPGPDIAALLQLNINQTLGDDQCRIKVFSEAISDSASESYLYYPDDSHGWIESSASLNKDFRSVHVKSVLVRTISLDEHIYKHPVDPALELVIKIDVESLEEKVLSGALKTVQRHRPAIFVEILPGASLEFYSKFLSDYQYTHFPLRHYFDRLIPADIIEPSVHRRDHLLMPKEKMPPCIVDNYLSRWKMKVLWLSGRGKQPLLTPY